MSATESYVSELPDCDLCAYYDHKSEPAMYDAVLLVGSWAFVCQKHYDEHAMQKTLGVGVGQKLVVEHGLLT